MELTRCSHVSLWLFHVTLWLVGICTDPLLLSPFLETGDIKSALELSEVRDPQNIIPKSYSGFITVDKQLGNHLFFWFFPAISDPRAPVLVWLNGGPGVSSMLGLLWENGPIRVTKDITDNGYKFSYKRWKKSWAESFGMLYIDNPVGTGYSFSDSGQSGWKTTINGYTEDLFSFISQFYILFPDYLNTQLYIGGQSYAGKYVPALAYRIHTEIQANKSSIPLAGIYIGGPYFDPYTQDAAHDLFYYSLGAITYHEYISHREYVKTLVDRHELQQRNLSEIIRDLKLRILYFEDNYYTQEVPSYELVYNLMNTDHIRQNVHVGNKLQFKHFNVELFQKFGPESLVSTKPQLTEIMDNYKVLIYSGDVDGIVTVVEAEEAILSIPWFHQGVYKESDRQRWKNGGAIVGYYTQVGRFCRIIVRNAGHQTPHDQPDATRKMMLDFVRHGCIQATNWEVNNQSTMTTSTAGEIQSTMTVLTVYIWTTLLLVSIEL